MIADPGFLLGFRLYRIVMRGETPMGKLLRAIAATVVVLLLLCSAGLWFMIQPDRQLNMQYAQVPWASRIQSAVLSMGVLTLSQEDATNLFKESIAKSPKMRQLPITGAAINLQKDAIIGQINLKKSFVTAAIQVKGSVRLVGSTLQITPTDYKIGQIAVSPETFQKLLAFFNTDLKTPFVVDMSSYIPKEIVVKDVQVEAGQLRILLLPKFLLR